MNNRLLQRQIRKFLSSNTQWVVEHPDFIAAIAHSYDNYEDQLQMLQRAMLISSDELFQANKRLREEAAQQKKIIVNLQQTINALTPKQDIKPQEVSLDIANKELLAFIEKQTRQIKDIEAQRAIILSDLEKSNRELSDYAHVVSHDLKSPLQSMNALLSWLREDYLHLYDASALHTFDMLLKKVEKMDHLINGILKYSSIDKVEQTIRDIDIATILHIIQETIYIPEHVTIQIKTKMPKVKADKFRMQQLFQNLISNAVSHIDKPKGIVEVSCMDKGGFWEFQVSDNGQGIAKAYHQKIFRPFEKLSDKEHATGIGLSIVKKVVDYYQGNIWLDSTPGIGTTFYFTIKK